MRTIVLGKDMDGRVLQPEKAWLPIVVMLPLNVTEVIFLCVFAPWDIVLLKISHISRAGDSEYSRLGVKGPSHCFAAGAVDCLGVEGGCCRHTYDESK